MIGLALRGVAAIVGFGALAACTTPQIPQPGQESGLPARATVASVPFHAQTENDCGPAALAMVLGWSGVPARPEELAGQVLTPGREGSLGHDLVAAARRADRLAVPVHGLDGLLAELAVGHPVLVLQNLGLGWYPQWHYAVAIGYDLEAGTLTLHSGEEQGEVVPLTTFARTWQRAEQWALAVLPPDRLPATADAMTVLQAAAGLEQAGRYDAAVAAYGAALGRWPDNLVALIGLGNARYAAGQLAAAEAAFRTAVSFHPGRGRRLEQSRARARRSGGADRSACGGQARGRSRRRRRTRVPHHARGDQRGHLTPMPGRRHLARRVFGSGGVDRRAALSRRWAAAAETAILTEAHGTGARRGA